MRIEILTTGDELTIGEILDGNAAWLGDQIFARGSSVARIVTVGDDLSEIVTALLEGASRADLLIVSGGLGPTLDDLTVEAVCTAFQREAVVVPEQLERIRRRFQDLGRTFTQNNERQALVPSGSEVLGNEHGTATAFMTQTDGCKIFCFPGVPGELRPLAEAHLFPTIEARLAKEGIFHCTRVIKCVGIPESHLDEEVRRLLASHPGVRYGTRTQFPENHLRLVAAGASQEEVEEKCAALDHAIRRVLGPAAYGAKGDSFPAVTLSALLARKWKAVLAESLTAGLAASLLAEVPGASAALLGSSVVYSDQLKKRWLEVPADVLDDPGPVSEACAKEMAEGALRSSGADVAVALTGWAGPEAGPDGSPAGTVFAAFASQTQETEVVRRNLPFGRNAVRKGAAYLALDLLRRKALGVPLA